MPTLLIDNYDSYTFNVYQLLSSVAGAEPIVVRNDAVSWEELRGWDVDEVVISPGPGRPERAGDFGVCADVIRDGGIPTLGICLGHQGLGLLTGAHVDAAPELMHGRVSRIGHVGRGLFAGIPQRFEAVRYHSLEVAPPLPEPLSVTAWSDDGVIMGLEHDSRPLWGVQFHPESICTEHGRRLVENFYALSRARGRAPRPDRRTRPRSVVPSRDRRRAGRPARPGLLVRRLDVQADTETLFADLLGSSRYAFWLDSARVEPGLSRFSFMGCAAGELGQVVEYEAGLKRVFVRDRSGQRFTRESIFEYLVRELDRLRLGATGLPFGLDCGFVGYLGYELKADCGGAAVHRAPVPDATLLLADRLIAVDHQEGSTYLLALHETASGREEAESWLDRAARAVEDGGPGLRAGPAQPAGGEPVTFRIGRGRSRYLADVEACQAALAAGESYEICLTDQIHADAAPDPLETYRILRRLNPAPYAAYLALGDVHVLSSSPERFLTIDRDRRAEAKPIKGTCRRGNDPLEDAALAAELAADEKTRAENLMIVDLLRNDLGAVSEPDSVEVARLMAIESYETVHQLVSTIRARLRADLSVVDCVRACFPGGSMTGAPKIRTMQIIDGLEREARGVYSGAIGYFGLGGAVDLSIVIRTILMESGRCSIGAGGAIVAQSDPVAEFDEMLLKARAPMAAIARAVAGSEDARRMVLEPEEELVAP